MPENKLFLVHFTFCCGEGQIPFHHTLLARDFDQAEQGIDAYLKDFAPDAEPVGHLRYEYWGGYYAVLYEWMEVASPESVVSHLMIFKPRGLDTRR